MQFVLVRVQKYYLPMDAVYTECCWLLRICYQTPIGLRRLGFCHKTSTL